MRRIRTACAVAVSVLSVSSFSSITAMAATQAQGQSLYSTQSQEVNTHSPGDIGQTETSSLSSVQTQTTEKQASSQNVDNQSQSYINSTQDHSVTGNGSFSQGQSSKGQSTISKTDTDDSVQLSTTAQSDSQQHSTITSQGTFYVKQSDKSVILGSQSQTTQERSTTTPEGTTFTSETTHTPDLTKDQDSVVIGYGVFDAWGNLLSDAYGYTPNAANNATKQYVSFASNTIATIYIAAMNANGKPIRNQNSTTVLLSSSNTYGRFEIPGTTEPIQGVHIPAGSFGVPILYVNTSDSASFDILNAALYVQRYAIPRPTSSPVPPVEATSQSQGATIRSDNNSGDADTSAGQSQITVVKSNTDPGLDGSQSSNLSQTAHSAQEQSVSNQQIHQQQTSDVNTQPNSTDTNVQSASVDVSQSEAANTNHLQLSQSQGVTVVGSVINVILSQVYNVDPSGGTSLTESIHADIPVSGNSGPSTVVNVTNKDTSQQQQYTLNTSGPISINESQTAESSKASQSASIDYAVGGTQYHIPLYW